MAADDRAQPSDRRQHGERGALGPTLEALRPFPVAAMAPVFVAVFGYTEQMVLAPRITYMDHSQTAAQILGFFPGVTADQLPGGEGWTVEEVALDWCIGPGVKLDFRHLPDGHVVTAAEVEAESLGTLRKRIAPRR